jgi:hypothetical protein
VLIVLDCVIADAYVMFRVLDHADPKHANLASKGFLKAEALIARRCVPVQSWSSKV